MKIDAHDNCQRPQSKVKKSGLITDRDDSPEREADDTDNILVEGYILLTKNTLELTWSGVYEFRLRTP
jgi:hypothetical protein